MGTTNVSVSLDEKLLEDVDRFAKADDFTRSDFLIHATRQYVSRKKATESLFESIDHAIAKAGATVEDVEKEIKAYRKGL